MEDVEGTPQWRPERGEQPALSAVDAVRVATAELSKYAAPSVKYQLASVTTDASTIQTGGFTECSFEGHSWEQKQNYPRSQASEYFGFAVALAWSFSSRESP